MTAPREEYTGRIARWNEIIARGERRHLRISNLRLVVFAGAGVVAWLALSRGAIAPAWLLLPAGAFLLLLVAHARVLVALRVSTARGRGRAKTAVASSRVTPTPATSICSVAARSSSC
jgi:hypothetical protein